MTPRKSLISMHYCNQKTHQFSNVFYYPKKIASEYVTKDNFVLRSLVNTKENLHKSSCEFYQNREIHWERSLFDIQLY